LSNLSERKKNISVNNNWNLYENYTDKEQIFSKIIFNSFFKKNIYKNIYNNINQKSEHDIKTNEKYLNNSLELNYDKLNASKTSSDNFLIN